MDSQAKTRKLERIAAAAIIVSAVITVIAYGFPRLGGGLSGSIPLAVAVGSMPGSALYAVDEANGTLSPIILNVEGQELHALDAVAGSDGSWYYILNEIGERPITNLYRRNEDGSMTRLTTSSTAKYNLSYDAGSGRLAYQASADTENLDFLLSPDWDLTIFDLATGEETTVATGTNPVLLPGGDTLLYKNGEDLILRAIGSDADAIVVSVPSGLYTVDAVGGTLAVYNDTTRKIDVYNLTDGASLSYQQSVETDLAPAALAYVDGELVAANMAKRDGSVMFIFSRPGSDGADPVRVTGMATGAPQRIYAYE